MQFDSPAAALDALLARVTPTATETCPLDRSAGRILREPVRADRPSPAADVSAMDGYALALSELQREDPIAVSGESTPGSPPPAKQPNAAIRIFTGAIVPAGCEIVVKREETIESENAVQLQPEARRLPAGANIRRCGENVDEGEIVLPAGRQLAAPQLAAAANFGAATLTVGRPVRVTLIVTGDELLPVDTSTIEPWQLRDSNGPTVAALLQSRPWIRVVETCRVPDQPEKLRAAISDGLSQSDALILSGGVSMGDYDDVPSAISDCGGEIVFHRIPIRPGKPVLGALGPDGQPIVGLPGNPVSAAVCTRRLVLPLLNKRAGGEPLPPCPAVTRADPDPRRLGLWWYPLVTINDAGHAEPVPSRGSGDLVSLARSAGFLEIPPEDQSAGPFPFYCW